ncbi:hypothetical protein Pelo_8481 [Pelomyxa schiedti]|nr:hypothetical protein Pelo_8481 [Pelomyxa schiedti]
MGQTALAGGGVPVNEVAEKFDRTAVVAPPPGTDIRLLVLGGPGAGKSTLCHKILRDSAKWLAEPATTTIEDCPVTFLDSTIDRDYRSEMAKRATGVHGIVFCFSLNDEDISTSLRALSSISFYTQGTIPVIILLTKCDLATAQSRTRAANLIKPCKPVLVKEVNLLQSEGDEALQALLTDIAQVAFKHYPTTQQLWKDVESEEEKRKLVEKRKADERQAYLRTKPGMLETFFEKISMKTSSVSGMFLFGSRAYNPTTETDSNADYDFIGIADSGAPIEWSEENNLNSLVSRGWCLPSKLYHSEAVKVAYISNPHSKFQLWLFSSQAFQVMLEENVPLALEVAFLPANNIWKGNPPTAPTIDPLKLVPQFVSTSHRLLSLARMIFEEIPNHVAEKKEQLLQVAQKRLAHSFRVLKFGLQILTTGSISDFCVAQSDLRAITELGSNWKLIEEHILPRHLSLVDELSSFCQRPALPEASLSPIEFFQGTDLTGGTLLRVLSYLPPSDLASCSMLNRSWNSFLSKNLTVEGLFNLNNLWKYGPLLAADVSKWKATRYWMGLNHSYGETGPGRPDVQGLPMVNLIPAFKRCWFMNQFEPFSTLCWACNKPVERFTTNGSKLEAYEHSWAVLNVVAFSRYHFNSWRWGGKPPTSGVYLFKIVPELAPYVLLFCCECTAVNQWGKVCNYGSSRVQLWGRVHPSKIQWVIQNKPETTMSNPLQLCSYCDFPGKPSHNAMGLIQGKLKGSSLQMCEAGHLLGTLNTWGDSCS